MLIDLTVEVTPKTAADARGNEKKALTGHLGTHFDVMDREFPLEYVKRRGIVFDVRAAADRDITSKDVDLNRIEAGMFAAFYTGFLEQTGYGTPVYFKEHPQLSDELIDQLLDKGVSIIGIDCAGIRRGAEHTPKDQYCADRNTFVVENLCGLAGILEGKQNAEAVIYTFPVRFKGMTGLPCRVVGEL